MLASSADLAALVTGVEYIGAWKLNLTLPAAASAYDDVTVALEHLKIEAQTTTDMPEGSRLQVGYPSIECEFTLSGMVDQTDETKTAAWLFGRYQTTSPLYRTDALYAPVTVDLGLYTDTAAGTPELIRKFTGTIDDYSVNDDGSVTFTALDKQRQQLRSVPSLPGVVTAPPYNAGLTSEFAIDYLLRAATKGAVSSWPAQRPQCVLAAGLRASLWAEAGSFLAGDIVPSFAPGKFGSGLYATQTQNARYALAQPISPSASPFVEFWATQDAFASVEISDVAPGYNNLDFRVTLDRVGVLTLSVASPAGGSSFSHSFTADALAHYVGVAFSWPSGSATWSATIYYDATTVTTGAITNPGARSATANCTNSNLNLSPQSGESGTVEALQITSESAAVSNSAFAPQAVLDPSLNPLTVIPPIDAGDPFQTIQQIADAELGFAGGDESGVFRFYNRNTLRAVTSARDITSAASLDAVGSQDTTAASVCNHATVEATPWSFAATNSTAWSAAGAVKVPRGNTKTLTVKSDAPFASLDADFTNLPDGSTDHTTSRYRASINKAGTAEHPGVTITAEQTASDTAVLTLQNNTAQDAWLVSPANYLDVAVGTPVLWLAGLVVTQGDTITREFAYPPDPTTTRFGDQATEISGNPWIQDDDAAVQLATDIVVDQCVPRPDLTGVQIVPDPRLQLTDVGHLVDPDRTGIDEYARVFGWTIEWDAPPDPDSPMTYTMSLDARTIAAPGGWIMGVAGRSEIGSTAYVYSGA